MSQFRPRVAFWGGVGSRDENPITPPLDSLQLHPAQCQHYGLLVRNKARQLPHRSFHRWCLSICLVVSCYALLPIGHSAEQLAGFVRFRVGTSQQAHIQVGSSAEKGVWGGSQIIDLIVKKLFVYALPAGLKKALKELESVSCLRSLRFAAARCLCNPCDDCHPSGRRFKRNRLPRPGYGSS